MESPSPNLRSFEGNQLLSNERLVVAAFGTLLIFLFNEKPFLKRWCAGSQPVLQIYIM
jgi:hypothetical protein